MYNYWEEGNEGTRPDAKERPVKKSRPPQQAPRRRRRGRNTLAYIMLMMVALTAGVVLSLTVFFKIGEVTVTGSNRYPRNEIIQATHVEIGDNLFRVKPQDIKDTLVDNYPYIESVAVRKAFPPAIHLTLTEATPMANIAYADYYVLISDQGRVLENSLLAPVSDVPVVVGVPIIQAIPGELMDKELWENVQMLQYVTQAMANTEFTGVENIDLSDRLNIVLTYEQRMEIQLGVEDDLEKKLRFAKQVIETELEETFEGILDATNPGEIRARPTSILQMGAQPLPENDEDETEENSQDIDQQD